MPDEKFISSIVCRGIHQLLVDKYPLYEFQVINGLCYTESGKTHSHTILGPGFHISVHDITVTVSKPTRVANLIDESFACVVNIDHDSVGFDLADPDSIDKLMAYVGELIRTTESCIKLAI